MPNRLRAPFACAVLLMAALVPSGTVQAAALGSLGVYRSYGSPVLTRLGVHCRFQPTCSRYAQLAITKYGVTRGVLKTGWRILRCNPLTENGTVDLP